MAQTSPDRAVPGRIGPPPGAATASEGNGPEPGAGPTPPTASTAGVRRFLVGDALLNDAPGQAEPVPHGGADALVLLLPDGASRALDVPLLLGRAPRPRPGTVSVPVRGESALSVSATHALLVPVAGGVLVRDLSSTNGTVVLSPAGVPLPAGDATDVLAVSGSIVVLGECPLRISRSGDD
ncbi:FHA domain-containing protein [Mycetocola reblochoni]|uniref:RDD domain containing protein n=2 Tax=Mycetocola reblochoni TaxID=331618 RepID=A0A1R4ICQ1_9MICO|nr:FHA domain-containing protein [Mycetocola reblochoni]RLP69116.1 FHA domain-containing protein [Mycetocola reblochoni]SJN17615.1 RDD domain containing protein [Mycetocola reblochoni REB411]